MKDLETMELKIARFLRTGVVVSGLIILTGWLVSFKPDSDPFLPLQTYAPYGLIDRLQVHALLSDWGPVITYFGLGILISLPVLRVFLSTILFIKQKEKMMALIGFIVMLGLILSFSLGVEG